MSPYPPITRRSVQGRRPLVSPTTVRRSRSARRRPGAGPLPSWRPAARVLKRGSSIEHFHVLSEEEFFTAIEHTPGDCELDGPAGGHQLVAEAAGSHLPRRNSRAGLVCLSLLGVAGALAALILASLSASVGHRSRRGVLRAAQPDLKKGPRGLFSLRVRLASERKARPREARTPGTEKSSPQTPGLHGARPPRRVRAVPSPYHGATQPVGGPTTTPSRREVDAAVAKPVRSATSTEFGFER
jgi:hypothetical protein